MALETAECRAPGLALGLPTGHVGPGGRVRSRMDDGHEVQRTVELPIATPVQSMTLGLPGRGRDWGGPAGEESTGAVPPRLSPPPFGEIFNIGGTEEVSMLELAQLVVATLGSSSKIELIPYDQAYAPGFDDMRRRKPLVEKLERCVQFRPQTTLQDIIRLTAK